jgi:hypothetical protein
MPYREVPEVAQEKETQVNRMMTPNVLLVTDNYAPSSIPIYIFSVSPLPWGKEQGIQRVPNHPHLYIKACPPTEEYVLVGEVAHPFPVEDFDTNGIRFTRWTNGYLEAAKMLNPQNPGLDQDWDGAQLDYPKNNLNSFGVFWSLSNPPKPEEVAAAKRRMEATFSKELAVLAQIEREDPASVKNAVTRTAHAAAEYFSQKNGDPLNFSWHNNNYRAKNDTFGKIECPNCYEKVHPKAAVCPHCSAILDEVRAKVLFPDRFSKVGRKEIAA